MKRYYKRKDLVESLTPTSNNEPSKQSRKESDLLDLQADLGFRPRITDYDPNIREQVRRAYLWIMASTSRMFNFWHFLINLRISSLIYAPFFSFSI